MPPYPLTTPLLSLNPPHIQRYYTPDSKEKENFRLNLNSVAHSHSEAPQQPTPPKHLDLTPLEAYTDGSSPDNSNLNMQSPAGWGFCIKLQEHVWIEGYGPLSSDPTTTNYARSQDPSNNSAEMQALLKLFDYLIRHPPPRPIHIFIDSSLTLDAVLGNSNPIVHPILVTNLRNPLLSAL